jgi:hypothetical protein
MPLTDTAIRNAKPGEKPIRRFDGGVSPTGGEWWRLKYRLEGKEKRLSLGVYPDVSLKDARDRRDASRKLLADGIDPSENRKATKSARADRAANSFEVVAREWFAKYSATWAARAAKSRKAPCTLLSAPSRKQTRPSGSYKPAAAALLSGVLLAAFHRLSIRF